MSWACSLSPALNCPPTVRQTTPLGIFAAETGLTPSRALLDYRQARCTLRLIARPRGRGGQEKILERKAGLTARVKEKSGLGIDTPWKSRCGHVGGDTGVPGQGNC